MKLLKKLVSVLDFFSVLMCNHRLAFDQTVVICGRKMSRHICMKCGQFVYHDFAPSRETFIKRDGNVF